MDYDIYHDLHIEASQQQIYDAITLPEHLINWWPLKCSGEPILDEEYNFNFGQEYNWFGKVIKAERNKAFHIKMTQSDADWDPTAFGFDIVPHENGTLLQFWHRNWPNCNAHFKRSSYCWAILLKGLKGYLEKASIIPFEERE